MPDAVDTQDLATWMVAVQRDVEDVLERLLPRADANPARLHEAMRYAVLGGGKRVRPLLVYASGEVSGAPRHALQRAAAAVEMVHAYSLVHDDMPAMDDDVLRRGLPTVHVRFDEATALLVGDALQTLAFESLCDAEVAPEANLAMLRRLAVASGAAGMAGGQAIDLAHVGRSLDAAGLEEMHRRKTGALLAASVMLGAMAGTLPSDDAAARLEDYARAIGLAFQVVDDILDVATDTATLGKTAGKDAAQSKPTYVSVLGMDASRQLAERLRQSAHAALAPFGARARRLAQIADFIVLRDH